MKLFVKPKAILIGVFFFCFEAAEEAANFKTSPYARQV